MKEIIYLFSDSHASPSLGTRISPWLLALALLLALGACGRRRLIGQPIEEPDMLRRTDSTYPVEISLSGLSGSIEVRIRSQSQNLSETLTFKEDSSESFPTELPVGADYQIMVTSQSGEGCQVSSPMGIIGESKVTIPIGCSRASRAIGGILDGLPAQTEIELALNGGAPLPLTEAGSFFFPEVLSPGDRYTITIVKHPAGANCQVTGASGKVGQENVRSARVHCNSGGGGGGSGGSGTSLYAIGGTVTGLKAGNTLVLQNGSDRKTVSGSSAPSIPFSFPTRVASGTAYRVLIAVQPAAQKCKLKGQIGSGTVGNADVANVAITCKP